MVIPTDTLYANQTHFNLIGDIEAIWDDYTGQGISLGIYDDGIQASHSDLDSNYNSALEIVDGNGTVVSSLPDLTQGTAGGTAVAGLIAAENNDAGTVGLANKNPRRKRTGYSSAILIMENYL